MKNDLFSVSKIFTERLLRIPDYQRGYSWNEKQLKDYWADIEQLENDKNHYIGVLTLEEVPSEIVDNWEDDQWIIKSKKYAPFYVVDGQQRLTTTIILIQAITESVKKGTRLNFTTVDDIKKKYLFDSKDDGVSRSYIFGYEKDNPSYEYLKTKIFLEKITSSYDVQETIYTHNLEHAKNFFIKRLSEMKINDIEGVYTKVTQNLLFNIYAISNDIDVFVAFETMNNRGKELSHLELLKNRLIYLSTKFNIEDYERDTLRKLINESWKSIYHYLGKNKQKPLNDDLFLKNHFVLYFGDIAGEHKMYFNNMRYLQRQSLMHKEYLLESKFTAKNIVEAGKNKLTLAEVKNYSESLKDSVETWYQILNPLDSKYSNEEKLWLEKLCRQGIEPVAPLIMVFFQKESKVERRVSLLKIIEKYIFFSCLVRLQHYIEVGEYNFLELSKKLAKKEISSEKVIEKIEEMLENYKKDKQLITLMKELFKKNGFYTWKGIKYFLYEYDLYLKSQSKTNRDKIEWESFIEDPVDHHTIEHVYPQRPKKECWTELYKKYSSQEKSFLRHSLGNLVPLSRAKNSSFQNSCFETKLGTEKNKVGFRYGSYTENEIAYKNSWTADDILNRGLRLLSFMEERWGISLGDDTEKIKFLNLSFMAKKEENITKTASGRAKSAHH